MKKNNYTLQELAQLTTAELRGDPHCVIDGIGSLNAAKQGQISFLNDANYRRYLSTTKASAVIMKSEDVEFAVGNMLVVLDPYVAYAKISALFDDTPAVLPGIHATAIIGDGCTIGENVSIGPYCVLGRGVKIGKNVRIETGSVIGEAAEIGDDTRLCAKVTLYHKVKIGKKCLFHSGVVIGSDGFGNANEKGVWRKIYQLGTVVIGDDVEIGANTTIDRGAIGDTVIEDGVRLDNQIQIGHNVHIGAHTAIAGCVGIAGSTKIGKYCMIGGGVGIAGHLEIANCVVITGMSSIGKTITEAGVYSSGIPAVPHRTWWRVLARLMQIENIIHRLKEVENKQK